MVEVMKLNNQLYPSDFDVYLFHEGTLYESYKMLGAHILDEKDIQGVRFAVWAPNARQVSVVGNFNNWNGTQHKLECLDQSGIWVLFIPELAHGDIYKYEVTGPDGRKELKADPYAFYSELRPETASIIYNLNTFKWQDQKWMAKRVKKDIYHKPMMIYEVHLASWKQKEGGEFYNYQELADELINYVIDNGFTHIELMPVMEHPYDGSWGYQITGYYSATSRYGTPEQLMYFIDRCHQKDIGVILDWVPAHFCKDIHGLGKFDGTALFESADPLRAERPIWGTYSFDYSKPEVVSFLISNAIFWMDVYHVDGFRIDAVSSMIYLNHDNPLPVELKNQYGSGENLEAIEFLKKLNETIFQRFPGALMMAEEATEWPLVTSPTSAGGLGFNYKWNMGWSNDVLKYMMLDINQRPEHHHLLTFSFLYAFSENFVLPFSHDEIVHGKRSLLNKMPGDYWQKFANLRLLFGYLFAHPGKKLLFMGSEFAQFDEWKYQQEMDWMLLDFDAHSTFFRYYKDLNKLYQETSSLWRLDHEPVGFHWIDADNADQSVITFMRKGKRKGDYCIIVCNFSATVYHKYQIGVPTKGTYFEAFNSDATSYGGSGQLNSTPMNASQISQNNQPYSLEITVPPLGIAIFMKETKKRKRGVSTNGI
ncbi:1,4-alpha-glucan branching protein GlgB [Psychrobacillus psychrodurans]|uniref:1,4-alpha-glucan branching protein GlgB n=1 Tax=Psychrobacillus psychrodurans TaxID=126157 RepID=UPI0008E3301C|nr:1,4-alpha-glucan branching protein GlgB [Psychrobacillus psychrodurans]MCZ8539637.1 1,4-alpha-glucan branching protein GlgB [Psychrobacillus psychrodurans]SFM43423.1 1,4-alpha-glucan branching enzyme [Psychrobacillus psychrodurans]